MRRHRHGRRREVRIIPFPLQRAILEREHLLVAIAKPVVPRKSSPEDKLRQHLSSCLAYGQPRLICVENIGHVCNLHGRRMVDTWEVRALLGYGGNETAMRTSFIIP